VKSPVRLVVYGQLYSMKNSKIFGRFKHPKARAFERDFALQVKPKQRVNMGDVDHPLRSQVTVYYPSHRQDLDCALVYDCLQSAGVIANDRFITEKHEYRKVDPYEPRVEITIEEL
jgi:Holliday junction resolvase RusA-like endonuclease